MRLGDPPATAATGSQPLQLGGPRPSQAEGSGEAVEDALLDLGERLQLGTGNRSGGSDTRQLLDPPPRPRSSERQTPLAGSPQRDSEVDLGQVKGELGQAVPGGALR